MTQDELEQDHWDRYNMVFRDCFSRLIVINEDIKLRDAITAVETANKGFIDALNVEQSSNTRVDGPDAYYRAQEATKAARRAKDDAKANAMAAFYRETGRWPSDLYGLGLR